MNGPYIFLSNLQDSKIPTYQRMWSFMESTKPGVFAQGNAEGLERVKKGNGKYAFLMESTTIEYVIERECDTTQIGGLLDSKGYGIALPPGMYGHSSRAVVGRWARVGLAHPVFKKSKAEGVNFSFEA